MRYVALIAVVNFVVLLFVDDLVGFNLVGGVAGALIIAIFGIPFAIIVGFPILWVARRINAGSAFVLVPLGALAGVGTALLVSFLLGMQPNAMMALVGATLGIVSSVIWWACVERSPERRARYD